MTTEFSTSSKATARTHPLSRQASTFPVAPATTKGFVMATRSLASESADPAHTDGLRAGVVGLGAIGRGVALSLLASGRTPHVYDIKSDAADGLKGIPRLEVSAAELARKCDVALVAVFNEEQAREALLGPDGLLAGARPGLIVVLLSTVSVPTVVALERQCAARNVALLDCGVTPGDQAPLNGIVGLLGGPDDVVKRAMPILQDFARAIVHCGSTGAGMTVKIVRNLITYATWAAVDEAATIAAAAGIEPATLFAALQETEAQHAQTLKMLAVRASGARVPQERLDNAVNVASKDLHAATSLATEHGRSAPLTEAIKPLMHNVFATHNASRIR